MSLGIFIPDRGQAAPVASCLGPASAASFAVYLHGLETPQSLSAEESANRQVLEKLAKALNLRIALPEGPLCPQGRRCWAAKNDKQIQETFRLIHAQVKSCWSGTPPYSLIGFSNGGYFALKALKVIADPNLQHIIASGSAGTWNPATDRARSQAPFSLMVGHRDITLSKAKSLAEALSKALPGFSFHSFSGGHHLDFEGLASVLGRYSKERQNQ